MAQIVLEGVTKTLGKTTAVDAAASLVQLSDLLDRYRVPVGMEQETGSTVTSVDSAGGGSQPVRHGLRRSGLPASRRRAVLRRAGRPGACGPAAAGGRAARGAG